MLYFFLEQVAFVQEEDHAGFPEPSGYISWGMRDMKVVMVIRIMRAMKVMWAIRLIKVC